MTSNPLILSPHFGAIINLQYLTALYVENDPNWLAHWTAVSQNLIDWAWEYSQTEPEDWENADTDWESDICDFFQQKIMPSIIR